ncbi:MsnO8 family LLM class oxidoreductase [Stackebrandtia nassauensis]|uniref:Luciferase-like monooxygenase n=1 Tax=Stackebrandtia nassauensis (strain DSM 44728 / CIP 108903 / NRRL B-16338 / NBRC 102104 / LLR-40K-21) TaxID=446470 RepID=D3Q4Y7_STANL|nr:MsnO8 family LLM class oxidoreductase [Stackebrandtia nassauensis]ADD42167.1 Luciferase-like monooxygenase [Stackebrandtia nassauensis DSM 44728]
MIPVPLSILDRSVIRRGQDPATALADTVRFARQAEQLGYRRFWVSEHHSVPGIAGSAPTVLAATIAQATTTIRVGTGGVMLPNHQPLIVAEQFGVLESLNPGRVDMGLGRSVGFTSGVRKALGHGKEDIDGFGEQLTELLGYFTGTQETHRGVHALPGEGLRPQPFVLAVGSGAAEAAARGLPLVIAPARGEDAMLASIARYREEFRPSVWAAEPHVVVALAVAVADTTEEARRLLLSESWSMARSRTTGAFEPLWPTADVLAHDLSDRERGFIDDSLAWAIYGTADDVDKELSTLVERAGAQEVLVTMNTFDRGEMLDSYRWLSELVADSS